MDVLDQVILFVVSLVANLFSAFSGGGAGLIQLPVLIFMGLPFAVALATHKVASVALGIGATVRHLRERPLERRLTLYILVFGLPGVITGANIILDVPERAAEVALGLLTAGLGAYSWLNPDLGQVVKATHRDRHGHIIGGLVLFAIGALNGSLTSGTGLFVTLWLVRWFGLDYRRAIAYTLMASASRVTLRRRRCCWARCWVATWARTWRSSQAIAGSSGCSRSSPCWSVSS